MIMTTGQASEKINVSPNTFKKLIAAGLLPDVRTRGNRTVVPAGDVMALARRDDAGLPHLGLPELPVLRVGAAKPADDGERDERDWVGYRTDLTPQSKLAALRGWWRCDPERVARAGALAVTVGPYVVALLTDLRVDAGRGPRYRFSAHLAGHVLDLVTPVQVLTPGAPGTEVARLLLGRRLESESGGPIAYASPPQEAPAETGRRCTAR